MIIAIASDHAGFDYKTLLVEKLQKDGYAVSDLGTNSYEPDDYPDRAADIANAIIKDEADRGILVCGSGVGVAVAANKFKGIRAGVCGDTYSAHQCVEHDDVNVLCLGERVIGTALLFEIVDAFLMAEFSDEPRHVRRVNKISVLEEQNMKSESSNQTNSRQMDTSVKILPDKLTATQDIYDSSLINDIAAVYSKLEMNNTIAKLFKKDPSLWKGGKEEQAKIAERLGWLELPEDKKERVIELTAFAAEVKKDGFKYAVLLGMGGSSLCSEVARATFGTNNGFLKLFILDDTDPASLHAIEKEIKIEKTLFIVASKSGNTKESLCFFQYFYALAKETMKEGTGQNFVAITDANTPLVELGIQYKFRKVFINPSDIGGRYSVLSDFGLLPMALIGVDLHAFMQSALQMEMTCRENSPAGFNPGISLGVALGEAALRGRDKVTFILSPSVAAFGYWVEQLIAESTGKEGKGLIPVNGEETGMPDVYGNDRIFVYIHNITDRDVNTIKKVDALENAGHPVIRIMMPGEITLGGEYYKWELATAIAGLVIGINPFDEPNVAESKKNTENILEEWQNKKSFTESSPIVTADALAIYAGGMAGNVTTNGSYSLEAFIQKYTAMAQEGDYIALLPYFSKTDQHTKILNAWRHQMRDQFKVATTLLHGPRYLHSTGQLHKGGPDTGLYIILTASEKEMLPIPGEKYGFDVLHHAQALGDFRSLSDKGRRVIRIDLGKDIDVGLRVLWKKIKDK